MAQPRLTIADVPGLSVGHASDLIGRTGCTVILAVDGAIGGVDVRGSAPGTRETDLLSPTALVDRIHAVCLAGGSAFGLAAADGVMRRLAERGIGMETGARPVPIVPAAVIFDLFIGSAEAYATAELGYEATLDAERAAVPDEGSIGAGTGATVGKLAGPAMASKGGVGTAGLRLDDGTVVAALAVTNAVGNVVARDGSILAGVRDGKGGFIDADEILMAPGRQEAFSRFGMNTTLAVIGTDAAIDRAACRKLAELGHDALARAIRPVHTMLDGDTVFTMATGSGSTMSAADLLRLGAAATSVLIEAIERSVLAVQGESVSGEVPGAPAT